VTISELAIVFTNLRGWLQTPPKGTPPPQGITNELVFKGVVSVFELFYSNCSMSYRALLGPFRSCPFLQE
jgi:hypothetical protein